MRTIGTIAGLPSAVVPAILPEHTLAVSKPGDGDPVTGLSSFATERGPGTMEGSYART